MPKGKALKTISPRCPAMRAAQTKTSVHSPLTNVAASTTISPSPANHPVPTNRRDHVRSQAQPAPIAAPSGVKPRQAACAAALPAKKVGQKNSAHSLPKTTDAAGVGPTVTAQLVMRTPNGNKTGSVTGSPELVAGVLTILQASGPSKVPAPQAKAAVGGWLSRQAICSRVQRWFA